jgi:Fe-S-cluster containining protein
MGIEEKPEFRCNQCGICCSKLIAMKGKAGLMLFPDEISLFPKESIKPCLAIGTFHKDKSFWVLTYQFTKSICPHLKDSKCSIYFSRPLLCKMYPIQQKLDDSGEEIFGLAPECPPANSIMTTFGLGVEIINLDKEMEAYQELKKRMLPFNILMDISIRRWAFNLQTNNWELYCREN